MLEALRNGMPLDEVGDLIGISRITLSKWAKKNPTLEAEMRQAIAEGTYARRKRLTALCERGNVQAIRLMEELRQHQVGLFHAHTLFGVVGQGANSVTAAILDAIAQMRATRMLALEGEVTDVVDTHANAIEPSRPSATGDNTTT